MTSIESFAGGQQLAVDSSAIEHELKKLWKDASQTPEGESTPALTRACQMNLVAWCDGVDEVAHATSVVATVANVRPCRVVMAVVDRDPARGDRLEASITAHCAWAPGGGKSRQVCCEQITITGGAGSAEQVRGAVLPLLLPDLPVFLWCTGDLSLLDDGDGTSGSELDEALLSASDRLMIDSCRFDDPAERFGQLLSLPVPLSDLSWERLRGWRELTAGIFDAPAHESAPGRIERIHIEYAGPRMRAKSGAVLLGAWAASRLGWSDPLEGATPRGGRKQGRVWRMSRPAGEPGGELSLMWLGEEAGPGVTRLRLEAPDSAFELARAGAPDAIDVTVSRSNAVVSSHIGRVVERDKATLLCRALEVGGVDRIYEQSLRLAARLFGHHPKETRA